MTGTKSRSNAAPARRRPRAFHARAVCRFRVRCSKLGCTDFATAFGPYCFDHGG